MNLTQQFLILSILPLAFIFLIGSVQRPQRQHRPHLIWQWTATLLIAAVWVSGSLTNFVGRGTPLIVIYNWQILSRYAFGLLGAGILFTTATYLDIPKRWRNVALVFFTILWVGAFVLDPQINVVTFTPVNFGGRTLRQFDLWVGVWAASWFLPLFAAWVLARQAYRKVPTSLYRNQVNYWLFALTGFLVGGIPALIQQRTASGWMQMSALLTIAAATVATLSLTRDRLPDLPIILRQNLRRFLFVLLVFLLTVGGIFLLTQTREGRAIASSVPGITIAAAGFALLIAILYRTVNQFFLSLATTEDDQSGTLVPTSRLDGNLADPQKLAHVILYWLQQQWQTEDGWLMVTVENGEKVELRPQASLTPTLPEPACFTSDSPFIAHLQRHPTQPLVQYDIDILSDFADLPQEERETLRQWNRLLYLPLHSGNTLVGVLALGPKREQATYTPEDFNRLSLLVGQTGPIFHLCQQLVTLRQTYFLETSEHQDYIEQSRRWEAVARLYQQFMHLVSPDIRKALGLIELHWQRTLNEANRNDALITMPDHLTKPLAEFKVMMDRLITVSGRIQKQSAFAFAELRLDDIVRTSINSLAAMAEARRVTLTTQMNSHSLPSLRGDEQRLQEALQYLLHNAIKFNKVGGQVELSYGRQDDMVYVRVADNGVGISDDRMAVVWLGLTQLNQGQPQGTGMGLGLPLARFIVEAHGGRIEAQSHYGSGSTFTIFLPIPTTATV